MENIQELVVPAVSGMTGVIGSAWFARTMISRWLEKNDKLGESIQLMTVELAQVKTVLGNLQKFENIIHVLHVNFAKLETKLDELARRVQVIEEKRP